MFTIDEEEQLVFQDRAAHVAAVLAALEGGTRRKCSGLPAVAEKTETFTVKIVSAELRSDVHRAGRGEVVRKIQAGLSELIGDRGRARGRRATFSSLTSPSTAIRAAESTPNRVENPSSSGRSCISDHAGSSCEIEGSCVIHRQIFNLLSGQASRHLRLVGIDAHCLAAHFHSWKRARQMSLKPD